MNMKKLIFFALMLVSSASYAQNQEIRLFSHRGGRLEFDENTMSAFQASYDAGYRGFEIDVRLTKDGKMVLFHDNSLDRCTDSTGPLEDLTFEQAMKVRTKKGNKLCTLDEFLDFIKDSHDMDVYVEFEVKTNPRLYSQVRLEELCDKLYKAVNAKKPRGAQFLFTSSDYRALRYLQTHHKTDDLLMITSKPLDDETIAMCKGMGITRIGAKMDGTSRKSVAAAKKAGLIVSLWPGLKVEDLMLGAYLGADFLCTDIPVEYLRFAKEQAPWLKIKY
jgi:glycerophosphoryl diester phosphodiesterase